MSLKLLLIAILMSVLFITSSILLVNVQSESVWRNIFVCWNLLLLLVNIAAIVLSLSYLIDNFGNHRICQCIAGNNENDSDNAKSDLIVNSIQQ